MRKHFLILMLLTLLPLAGWAQTATLGDVGVGNYTYGDNDLPVPVVKDSEGAILSTPTHYSVSTVAYDKTTNKVVEKQDMKGDQELYLKITGVGAYVGQEKKAYFTVQKKTLTITCTTDFKRDYLATVEPEIALADWSAPELVTAAPWSDTKGDLGTLTYTYAGYGKPEYAGGEYDITFSGLSSDCYEIKYPEKKKFKIVGTDLSGETVNVKAGTAFANKTYKGAAFAPADLTGLVLVWNTKELVQGTDFTIAKGTSGDWKSAGSGHKYTVNFKGNYSGTQADFGTFTIDQAPVTVTCEDYAIDYDAVDHKTTEYKDDVTFTWMGLVGEDVAAYATVTAGFTKPTKVQVGSTAINAADYALKIEGGAAAGNYNLVGRLDGKLTIKKVDVEVKAKAANKTIGASDPKFELVAPTLQGADALNTDATITFTRAAGETAGTYDITPDVSTIKIKNATAPKDRTSNYNIKLATPKGQLTIGKTAITVTFKNASKFYGQADPTFDENSYVVDGLQKGDALPAFTIVRENAGKPAGEAVGYYAISATIANPNTDKYTSVTVVPGALQIKKAQLTFTMPAQNLAKGKKASDLSKATIKVDGINNSDVAAKLYDLSFNGVSVDGEYKTDVDQTIADGIYATLTTAAQDCYEVTGANKVNATTAFGKIIVGDGTAVALAFTTAADDADYNLIKDHAGEVQNVTITLNNRVDREVPTGTAHPWAAMTWNTMVLPFEVTVAELSYQLGYAIVNVVDPLKTTEGNVQFKLEMGKIPANTPFCVKTDANIADGKVLTFSKRLIVDAGKYPSVDAGNGYKFVGAYQNLKIDKNTPTYNFLRGDNNKWAHIGATSANDWKVVPFDAYVDLSAASAPEAVTFTFEEIDGSTTAIKNVDASVNDVKAVKAGWYTIDGKKLNAAPAQKGIYIYNGKKYVVK